ncbi:TonB-dependent siderophore receptor [Pseudomonas aeruginosa]|uniref:TonB-dependent siderophore receptor n=1 Tax=Pseudomonas aeruginosa TaxID=287 RepID=UPI0034D2263D
MVFFVKNRPTILRYSVAILVMMIAVPIYAADSQLREYSIPKGPLDESLLRFAAESDITISFAFSEIKQKQSDKLDGLYSIASGFAILLDGTGWEAVPQGEKSYTLKPKPLGGFLEFQNTTVVSHHDAAISEGENSYTIQKLSTGKSGESLRETPRSVTVITQQLIKDKNLITFQDALKQAPGVEVVDSNPEQPVFRSRGFSLNSISFDGVNMGIGGQGSISVPDLFMFDHVEIRRGPDALFSGSGNGDGSIGGTVTLLRKRPTSTPQMNVTLASGSWRQKRAEVDVSGPISPDGKLRGRLAVSSQEREYFYGNSDHRRNNLIYGIFDYQVSDETIVAAGLSYERRRSEYIYPFLRLNGDSSFPGYYSRSTNLSKDWGYWNTDVTDLFSDITHYFGEDWKLKFSIDQKEESVDVAYAYVEGNPMPSDGKSSPYLWGAKRGYNGRQLGADINLAGGTEIFGLRQELVFGANGHRSTLTTEVSPAPFASRPGPNYVPVDIARFNPSGQKPKFRERLKQSHVEDTENGIYGQLRLRLLEPLLVSLGGRYSNYEYDSGRETGDYKESSVFTPYGGISLDLNDNFTAYVSYGEVFRIQNLYEASGQRLTPVTGANYEIGLKGEFYGGLLNSNIAIFRIDQENLGSVDPDYPSACPASPIGGACYIAGNKSRSQGVDTEISGELLPGFQVMAGYTWTETEYLRSRNGGIASSSEGAPFYTSTPKHEFKFWGVYQLPGDWSSLRIGGGVTTRSDAYYEQTSRRGGKDFIGRVEQGGYSIFDLFSSYSFDKNWEGQINLNNIFDKRYYKSISATTVAYGDPRGVMFTLRGSF